MNIDSKDMKRTLSILVAALCMVLCGARFNTASAQQKDEVVSDGYTNLDTKKNANSINRVKIKDEDGTYNTIFDYLRGRVPGVQIGYAGPGGTPSVIIRGQNSFNASTEPLFVVDGAVVSDPASINPNDVDKVDVLKDASTAIYGSRGAGGVIVIKTKTARAAAEAEQAARKAAKAQAKASKKNK